MIHTLLHSRIRLAAASALAKAGEMDFTALKKATGATEGNLSTHLRKLEDAGYLTNLSVFELTELPARMAFIGAGPIGLHPGPAQLWGRCPHHRAVPRTDATSLARHPQRRFPAGNRRPDL